MFVSIHNAPFQACDCTEFQSPTECDVRFDSHCKQRGTCSDGFQSPTECDVRFDIIPGSAILCFLHGFNLLRSVMFVSMQ